MTGIVKYLLEGKDPQAFLEPEKGLRLHLPAGGNKSGPEVDSGGDERVA